MEVDIESLPDSPNQVGLDLGITRLVTLSTVEKVANPKSFKAKYRKLRKAQKPSHKQKGANHRYKARLKVASIQAEIAHAHKGKLSFGTLREHKLITQKRLRMTEESHVL